MADVYTSFTGLNQLRASAANHATSAKRETAEQFEAVFVQMMLKSMRATVGQSMLDNDQSELAMDMYDKQLANHLAKTGALGIADLVLKQLGDEPASPHPSPSSPTLMQNTETLPAAVTIPTTSETSGHWRNPKHFIESLLPAARESAAELGTQPEAVLAVAALETGWGQHVMRDASGQPSRNLFGIKATRDWQQGVTWAQTLEFESGVMRQKREPFRQYRSANDSIRDFATFIKSNPRYRQALQHAADPSTFLQEMHKAGYATDPNYTQKVTSVMLRIQKMTQELS